MSSNATSPSRAEIVDALRESLESASYVVALWESGSVAFGRVDALSDIDLQMAVEDEQIAAAFELVEVSLAQLASIEARWEVPSPTWHGHAQRFYRLAGTSPHLLIDVCVMRKSTRRRFLEPERHGRVRVLFDKQHWIEQIPMSEETLRRQLESRTAQLRARLLLFGSFVEKELARGHLIDALAFYQSLLLRPLVDALRIRYDPCRHDFGPRYLHHDLPVDIVARLSELWLVHDSSDLHAKQAEARAWLAQILDALE